MALYYLASIAGLFPGLTLPLSVGWKEIHVFDALFVACLGLAAARRAVRPPDWRLMIAGVAVVAAGVVAAWAHPSPEGLRVVSSIAYSVVVLLAVSHLRLDVIGVSVNRTVLWPLFLAVGIAWAVFLFENLTGIAVAQNDSPMLPASVHRLGGFTGGNTLILFLCLGAPLVRAPGWILLGVLPSALATLSRGVLGVGAGLIVRDRITGGAPPRLARAVRFGAWSGVAISLFFYAFAVIPVVPSERSTARLSLEPGGYLTPHLAALRAIRSSPLVGVGPAAFSERFRTLTLPEERERLPARNRGFLEPHSALLGLAAEQGLLGLAAFVWLICEIFRRLTRIADPHLRSASMAGLAGLLVGGHFVDWLALKGLWLWIGLMLASRTSTQGNLRGTSL